ncbi:hypothetical protein F4604DRAFT_1716930 [Suillus subluteus]|nr:hypothetical protein F4604DRAFT_1716930 [Suillus subluteus]
MRAITLVQLPPELLFLILVPLGAHDLVRVRKTCKTLKETVDHSEMLQYVIDLGYFQMEASEMDVPPATRRERLRQHDAAWQRFEYKQKYTLPAVMVGPLSDILGGVYGSAGSKDCIIFACMPFGTDSNDLHSWNCPVDATTLMDFTFCPAQDLLVVVALSPDSLTYAYDIHLRSLTTNDAHPDAAQPILKALDTDTIGHAIPQSTSAEVHIMGSYVIMLLWNVVVKERDCMQMWDWKSKNGYQFSLLFNDGIHDWSFIAEDQFLVLDIHGIMEIYSIADKSKPPRCTAKLSLPSLMDHFSYTEVSVGKNVTSGSMLSHPRRSYQPPCPFHPSTSDQLIVIHVGVEFRNELFRYSFFTLRSAILELESLFYRTYGQPTLNGPKLLWSMWGPRYTTWFRATKLRKNDMDWVSSLYGFRAVDPLDNSASGAPLEPRRLRIRNFNPHIARHYHAQDKPDYRGRLVQGELTNTISRPFTEPLGSALPYHEIVSEGLFYADTAHMDESRIMLVKRDRGGQKIDILVF